MFSQTIQGIIIKITNFHEADKIVTVFSKELGKTQFIAKGVRKVKSKTSGIVDLFIEANFELTNKSQLPTLIQAQLITWFPYLRTSLAHWQFAERAARALYKATKEHDPHPELYFLLRDFLMQGKDHGDPQYWWLNFLWQLLFLSGFGINLSHCLNCAQPLVKETVGSKIHTYEGFRCRECSLKVDANDQLIHQVLVSLENKENELERQGFAVTQGFLEDAFKYHFL
ncbi:MAG: DNA repair protein RecO [Candidatus Abawacabacteria bacterium]|nr:DNA repair protein RecO [Candidatus Abawacabacteria bacterium]